MKITRRSFVALTGSTLASLGLGGSLPALAAGSMGQIKERGTLRVGVTQAPPWYSKELLHFNRVVWMRFAFFIPR